MGRRKKVDPIRTLLNPEDTMSQSYAMTYELAYEQLTNKVFEKWNLQHRQLFGCILEHIDWEHKGNSCRIEINNRDVAENLGWVYSENQERKIVYEIVKLIDFMCDNSKIKLKDPYNHQWYRGNLIEGGSGDSNFTTVRLNPDFMNHFEGMYRQTNGFPAFLTTDLYSFRYSISCEMYQRLRLKGKADGSINKMEFTMTQLRDILKVAPDSYMKKITDPDTGEVKKKYDRTNFIKKAFVPVLEDLSNSEVIEIIPDKDGKLYHTIREGGKVSQYVIKYKIRTLTQIKEMRKKKWKEIIDVDIIEN